MSRPYSSAGFAPCAIAASDPFGVGTTASLWFFRRPLPTANFRSHTVMWDGANTVGTALRDGLIKQARGNVTGAQQGAPATDAVIFEIADYEAAMANAQLIAPVVGRLDADGAHGGPEAASAQPLLDGRFDLYDAWQSSASPARRQNTGVVDLAHASIEIEPAIRAAVAVPAGRRVRLASFAPEQIATATLAAVIDACRLPPQPSQPGLRALDYKVIAVAASRCAARRPTASRSRRQRPAFRDRDGAHLRLGDAISTIERARAQTCMAGRRRLG